MWLVPPWLLLAGALAIAGASAAGTWRVQEWRHAANEREERDAAAELARERGRGVDLAAAEREKDRTRTEEVVRWVTKEIDREVAKLPPAAACLSPNSLRVANAAIDAANEAAGEPAPAVPAASAPR